MGRPAGVERIRKSREWRKKMMLQGIGYLIQGQCRTTRFTTALLAAVSLGASFVPAFAQQPGEQAFASPQDAAHALFVAMDSQDQQSPLRVLGPAAKDMLSSGDAAEDA